MTLLQDQSDYRSPEFRPSWFTRTFPSVAFYRKLYSCLLPDDDHPVARRSKRQHRS